MCISKKVCDYCNKTLLIKKRIWKLGRMYERTDTVKPTCKSDYNTVIYELKKIIKKHGLNK